MNCIDIQKVILENIVNTCIKSTIFEGRSKIFHEYIYEKQKSLATMEMSVNKDKRETEVGAGWR